MADNVQLRALYDELLGILAQTPTGQGCLQVAKFWELYHQTVSRLETETGEDFSRFRAKTHKDELGYLCTDIVPFRQKIETLITRLYDKYSPHPNPPFSGRPPSNINVSTNVSESQAVDVQMILDFQSAVDKKVNSLPDDSKEKQWWGKVKGSLGTMTSLAQLVGMLINSAQEYGLTIDQLQGLFT